MRAVNLIPADRRASTGGIGRSGGAVYVILGALGGLLLLTTLYAVANHQVADRKAQLAKATQDTAAASARATQLAPYKQFSDLRDQREQAIVGLAATRFDWPTLMRNIASALPAGVVLTTFDGSPAGSTASTGTPASPTPAAGSAGGGPSVHLVGCAASHTQVGDVINRLRGVPEVVAVTFTSSTKTSPGAGSSAGSGGPCSHPGQSQFDLSVGFSAGASAAPSAGAPASTGTQPAAPPPASPTAAPATGSHP